MKYLNKKSLGQNFLVDKNIILKIINLINLNNKNVIEIGPGAGALTDEILKKKPKSLLTIEKDFNLSKELKNKYLHNRIFKNINADILKFDLEKSCKKNTIILGNLPYNISSQILVKILNFKIWPPNFTDVIFMFQKELGQKIIGKFSSKDYGRISILTDYRLSFISKFIVTANCFFPKPKIDSIVIHFKPKMKTRYAISDLKNLERVTNILFSNKRKMVNKNIKKILKRDYIEKINNLNLQLRPSKIRPNIFYRIAELYEIQ